MKRLIIRGGAIGDCVLSFPALEFLAAEADECEVWVPAAVAPLIGFAARVRVLSATGLDLVEIPGADASHALGLLGGFDSIVSFVGAKREEFRRAVRHLPFRFLPALPPEGSGKHAADFFLEAAGGRGRAVPGLKGIADRARRNGAVVIHPFSGSGKKNWSLDRYRELARGLGRKVIWLRGAEDPSLEEAGPVRSLKDVALDLAGAELYIGNDSGVTHVAAAAGAPVLALFGPTDPGIWGPRGERVRLIRGELEALEVSSVREAAQEMLAARPGAGFGEPAGRA